MSINRGIDKEDMAYINIYTHAMEQYSAIKRNGIVPFAETWVDLEIAIQSEVSHKGKKKTKYYIFNAYMWNLDKQFR